MLTFSRASNPWATLSTSSESSKDLSPTAELDPLLSHLSTALAFLSRVLAPAPLRRIARAVLAAINSTLFDSVLRASFSAQGAAQLAADLAAICAVVDEKTAAGSVAASALRKCLEAATLVGLPVKGGKPAALSTSASSPVGGDEDAMEEWDAWAADDADADADADANANAGDEVSSGDVPQKASSSSNNPPDALPDERDHAETPGLWEVEKRLFADNQSARDVLDQLGFEVIDEKEARRLLRLRVELAG